ncbi:hypothetical protein HY086_05180 [Candidatus Gottesmanbacteria bacterium]|nr:hypothetical protein [Candidatus Gottesmanbacteria bacterium]
MKKIEIIWREILEKAAKTATFEQKQLAEKFHFSTSTVFAAVSPLRDIGAIAVTGRNFRITNLEKILLFWATHRRINRDIVYQTHAEMPVMEIEGLIDNHTIYGAYSAARILLKAAPSEYDKAYFYHKDSKELRQRFPPSSNAPNIFVLKADPFLPSYGKTSPLSQTYVDLWNLKDWYADEFLRALKEKFYGFL